MSNFTNKVVKKLTFNEQKEWHNKNNWSIFQDHLVSKGATTYRHPISSTAGLDEKLSFSGDISEPWQQIGQDIDGEASGDQSGYSVSLSADGSVMAVGAIRNNGIGLDSGHVRVYEFKEGSWEQLGQDIDGEASGDQSGYSVSLSADGSIVAIGAPYNDGNGDDSGHVRVYQYDGSIWEQLGEDIDAEAGEDLSGRSVSLSADGSIVAIGAPYNDGNGNFSGHVRVYEFKEGSWQQLGGDIDAEAGDQSGDGTSVSLSADGSIVAIGAPYNDGSGSNSGHVRVYQYDGSSWEQLGGDIDGEASLDKSGVSVSLSANGSIVAIGAPYNDGDGTNTSRGHVRIYQYNGSSWQQLGGDIDGEEGGDQSGWSVSLSADGSVVAIGANGNDGNGNNSGHVRVYQYDGSIWEQLGVDIDGEAIGVNSGRSVSLSADGSVVAIGSDFANGTRGKVLVYRHNVLAGISQVNHFNAKPADIAKNIMVSRNGPQWEQVGADIDGKAAGDKCGYSVSLSADGMVMAIGSPYYDTPNQDVGQVRIFEYNGVSWQQRGGDFNGIPIKEIRRGHSVFLNANGSYVAMGSYASHNVEGTVNNVGIVRIYQYAASKIQEDENGPPGWNRVGQEIEGQNEDDFSGRSISLSSDGLVVAIGATSNSGSGKPYSGHVRVYKYNGTDSWIKQGGDIHGESSFDNSGYSVSLSADGSIVAIGARWNDGPVVFINDKRGSVRVYKYNGTDSWIKRGGDIDGEATGDQSGHSVSLSADGSIVAIGAIDNDGSGSNSGHVRVYKYNGTDSWIKRGGDIDGEATGDQSGWYVSLSADGKVVAIGAIDNDGSGSNSGHVRVYQYDASKTESQLENQQLENYGPVGWNRIGGDIDGVAQGDESGHSVSLNADGSVVAIGSPGTSKGTVRVYQIAKRNPWVQQGLDIIDNGSNLLEDNIDIEILSNDGNHSVSLSNDGKVLAIGFRLNDGNDGNHQDIGLVRVFENTDGLWKQKGSDIYGEVEGDQKGISVSLSGDGSKLAVGATGSDDNGYVRVYEFNAINDDWIGGAMIAAEASRDQSGFSVSLSSNGSVVAIGAPLNDGANGVNSGHVRVFEYREYTANDEDENGVSKFHYSSREVNGEQTKPLIITGDNNPQPNVGQSYWIQKGTDIDGEAFRDESGSSVSLSANGSIVAIGSIFNNIIINEKYNSGHVRVYQYDGSIWEQLGGDIDGEEHEDQSGWSVSLSADGSIVAIGAINNDDNGSNSGHVRVYRSNPDKLTAITDESSPNFGPIGWDRIGGDIHGEGGVNEFSGWSVSLSGDGSLLAIGAPLNDGNGNDSGHVRIYQHAPNKTEADEDGPIGWSRLGRDIDGEEANYYSGATVSLSSDGSTVAIGGTLNTAQSDDTPRVRVYKFTGWGV